MSLASFEDALRRLAETVRKVRNVGGQSHSIAWPLASEAIRDLPRRLKDAEQATEELLHRIQIRSSGVVKCGNVTRPTACEVLIVLAKKSLSIARDAASVQARQLSACERRREVGKFIGADRYEMVEFAQSLQPIDLDEWNWLEATLEREFIEIDKSSWSENRSTKASHSTDCRSVLWFGDRYTFTPIQAACVALLWENWERGTPDLGEQTILETADSSQRRLINVFNNGKHSAWNTMIRPGSTRGTFRLAEPN